MIATFGRGGFIGSYLPPEFVWIDVDVRTEPWDWPRWFSIAPEAALNLACVQPARGVFPEGEYERTNVEGFWHVCIWAFTNGIRKVVTMLSQKTALEGEIGKLVRTDRDVMGTITAWFSTKARDSLACASLPSLALAPTSPSQDSGP